MDQNLLDMTLQTAVSYANMASTVFNMFLTVVFGSLAFAAAIPLRDIGRSIQNIPWHISSSSFLFGIALLSFYIISFLSFNLYSTKAEEALVLLNTSLSCESPRVSSLFVIGGKPLESIGISLGLPSIGFIIGATFGLIVFLWVANAERHSKSK